MIEKIRNIINKPSFIFYVIIIYLVGLWGLGTNVMKDVFISIIPYNILLANIVLLWSAKNTNLKFWISVVLIAITGFYLEYFGVLTGRIFGVYNYGNILGPKALDVPYLIGINWVFMVLCGVELGKKLSPHYPVAIPFISGLFMLLYDIFLEKFAIHFGMWIWYSNGVPIQNYVSWFVFGTLFSCIYYFNNRQIKIPIARALYIIQVLFFLLLSFTF